MKKVRLIVLLCFIFLGIFLPMAASAGGWKTSAAAGENQEVVQTKIEETFKHEESGGVKTMTTLTIQIGDKTFSVFMKENATTQALFDSLPMTVTMNEMNGNEKYYYLPSALPTDTQSVGSVHAGDLMLYGSDCLVLFYEDFPTSYRYTRLGSIQDATGLSEALGSGNVQVTFRLDSE